MPKSQSRLTVRLVENLKPGELVWDNAVAGFGVRCQRSRKVYVLKASVGGRQRWFSIGEHGSPWTPDTARSEAQILWGRIRKGDDPASVRESRRHRPTIADLCLRYLEDHAREHKKPSSAHLDARLIENHVVPLLGKVYVEEVKRADIDRLKRAVRDGRTIRPGESRQTNGHGGAVITGGIIVANRCVSLLSKMFNLAEVWGWRAEHTNPTRHVAKYKEERRERFLSADELKQLGAALDRAAQDNLESPFAIAAIRLLILVGARRSEILSLRWEDVDLAKRTLELPDSNTGRKTIWLNDPAYGVLLSLPRLQGNPFVIAGMVPGQRLVNIHKPWRRLCKMAGISNVRLHDLRHTFASIAVTSGVGLQMTGKLLGHRHHATTERYAHLADAPIRQANNAIGARIGEALEAGRHATAEEGATP